MVAEQRVTGRILNCANGWYRTRKTFSPLSFIPAMAEAMSEVMSASSALPSSDKMQKECGQSASESSDLSEAFLRSRSMATSKSCKASVSVDSGISTGDP
jgi:hypothetical protein